MLCFFFIVVYLFCILYFICIFLLLLPTWRIKLMMKLMINACFPVWMFLVLKVLQSVRSGTGTWLTISRIRLAGGMHRSLNRPGASLIGPTTCVDFTKQHVDVFINELRRFLAATIAYPLICCSSFPRHHAAYRTFSNACFCRNLHGLIVQSAYEMVTVVALTVSLCVRQIM